MEIRIDDLRGEAVQALLLEHLGDMHGNSPACSVHALDLTGLRQPEITFWTVWDKEQLAACGALKALPGGEGEIKSMRSASAYRGRGAAQLLLQHIITEARRRGYRRLNLETGTAPFFEAARRFYLRAGFQVCGPFADYGEDPYSAFMTLALSEAGAAAGSALST